MSSPTSNKANLHIHIHIHIHIHVTDGEGVYRWNNGKTRKGEWQDDKLVKWTSNESFGSIINYTKPRPAHLNKKGNLKIIKETKDYANHRVAAMQQGK